MRQMLGELRERRARLVERSTAQRNAMAHAAGGMQAAVDQPVKIGLSALLVLAGASARWRGGFVRAWVLGSLLRRLIWR